MELSQEEIGELLRCALNRRMTIYPATKARTDATALLIAKGYMQSHRGNVFNVNHYPTLKPGMKRGAKAWLTEQGKAAILALSPADFEGNHWWPQPADVQRAAARVAGEDTED